MPEIPKDEDLSLEITGEKKPYLLTTEEKTKIHELYFVDHMTQEAIAKAVGRSAPAVARAIHSAEGIQFKKRLTEEMQERVRHKAVMLSERALDSWAKQLDLADKGEKAQHLPAKELLTHAKTFEVAAPNTDRRTQVLIQIGGSHEGLKVVEGEAQDDDAD